MILTGKHFSLSVEEIYCRFNDKLVVAVAQSDSIAICISPISRSSSNHTVSVALNGHSYSIQMLPFGWVAPWHTSSDLRCICRHYTPPNHFDSLLQRAQKMAVLCY